MSSNFFDKMKAKLKKKSDRKPKRQDVKTGAVPMPEFVREPPMPKRRAITQRQPLTLQKNDPTPSSPKKWTDIAHRPPLPLPRNDPNPSSPLLKKYKAGPMHMRKRDIIGLPGVKPKPVYVPMPVVRPTPAHVPTLYTSLRPVATPAPVDSPRPIVTYPSTPVDSPRPIVTYPSTPVHSPKPIVTYPSTPIDSPRPVVTYPSTPVDSPRPVITYPSSPVESPRPVYRSKLINTPKPVVSPTPAYIHTPYSTPRPVVTSTPVDIPAPAYSPSPYSTPRPVTSTPVDSFSPAYSLTPYSTPRPVVISTPVDSPKPVYRPKLIYTPKPVGSYDYDMMPKTEAEDDESLNMEDIERLIEGMTIDGSPLPPSPSPLPPSPLLSELDDIKPLARLPAKAKPPRKNVGRKPIRMPTIDKDYQEVQSQEENRTPIRIPSIDIEDEGAAYSGGNIPLTKTVTPIPNDMEDSVPVTIPTRTIVQRMPSGFDDIKPLERLPGRAKPPRRNVGRRPARVT